MTKPSKIDDVKISGLLNNSDYSSEFATSGSSPGTLTEITSLPDAPKGQSDTLTQTGTHGRRSMPCGARQPLHLRMSKTRYGSSPNWSALIIKCGKALIFCPCPIGIPDCPGKPEINGSVAGNTRRNDLEPAVVSVIALYQHLAVLKET